MCLLWFNIHDCPNYEYALVVGKGRQLVNPTMKLLK